MSRSRKKTPIVKDSGNGWAKKLANNRVKATDDIASGAAYKRVSNSWDICDWKFRVSKPKKGGRTRWGRHVTEEEMLENYRKAKRK